VKWASAELDLTRIRIASLADFGKAYGDIIAQMPAFKTLMADGPILPSLKEALTEAVSLGAFTEEIRKSIVPAGFAEYAAGFRVMDQLAGERLTYLKAPSALSESIVGSGTLTASRPW
jgi:hypothetical protein